MLEFMLLLELPALLYAINAFQHRLAKAEIVQATAIKRRKPDCIRLAPFPEMSFSPINWLHGC